jgi:hypothetical protein
MTGTDPSDGPADVAVALERFACLGIRSFRSIGRQNSLELLSELTQSKRGIERQPSSLARSLQAEAVEGRQLLLQRPSRGLLQYRPAIKVSRCLDGQGPGEIIHEAPVELLREELL